MGAATREGRRGGGGREGDAGAQDGMKEKARRGGGLGAHGRDDEGGRTRGGG